jgi:uncharacterized LabA/DUF88 family protein
MSEIQPTSSASTHAPGAPTPKNSVIYVDGFNFYYGLLHEFPERKWLNLQRFCELLRPDDEILKIRYFTTKIDTEKMRSEKRDRQGRIWDALRTQPKIQFTYGKFANRERDCLGSTCPHRQSFWTMEEKQTDVNIALAMVRDVAELKPQVMVLFSGDIDLLPALEEVHRLDRTIKIVVYIPLTEDQLRHRRTDEYAKFASVVKPVSEKYLKMAQFPKRVPDGKGGFIECPEAWRGAD